MADTLQIPDKQSVTLRTVTIPVSTKVDGEKVTDEFSAELPATLEDAIAYFGRKEVFRKFINSQVVYLQGQKRNDMRPATAGKERKRATYMEELGL
jgi:hypothetical protein